MKDTILFGDCRETLNQFDEKARVCVTSPPYYGLRDYGGEDNQIGQEQSPEEYIQQLVEVFRQVKNVLTDDGTLWLNIGDSYYNYRKDGCIPKQTFSNSRQDLPVTTPRRSNKLQGYKDKDLIGIPWMLAFALRADGWYLRQDIIWHKHHPSALNANANIHGIPMRSFSFNPSNLLLRLGEYSGKSCLLLATVCLTYAFPGR
jgi:DNA modification methylase